MLPLFVVLIFVSAVLYRWRQKGDVNRIDRLAPVRVTRSELFHPIESRGKDGDRHGESNEAGLRNPTSASSGADGDWILSLPIVEAQMAVWAFTNAGISPEHAKGLLRPALAHLYAGAVYKERIAQSEVKEIEEMKSIRENDTYSDGDKIGFMIVKAAAYRGSRESWVTDREQWMDEFDSWIATLGVTDPEALKRDLLLIQPTNPPPDPRSQ